MKRLAYTAAIAAALVSPAAAQVKPYATHGAWTAISGINNGGVQVCGIVTYTSNRSVIIKWDVRDVWYVHLAKLTWSIPSSAEMPLAIQFDNNEPFVGTGQQLSKTMVELPMRNDGETFKQFMNEFMDRYKMFVSFPGGNEPRWTINLDGSEKIGPVFAKCIGQWSSYGKGNTQPHGPGVSTQPHQGGESNTQPYSTKPAPVAPSSKNERSARLEG